MRHGETLGTNPTPVPRLPNPLRPHLPQSCASLSPHHSSRSPSSPVNPGRLRRAPASTTTSQHPRQGGSRAGRQWPAREGSDGQQDWESTGTSRGERATTSEGTCPRWSTPPLLSQVILAALLLSQVIPAPLLLSQDPGFLLFFLSDWIPFSCGSSSRRKFMTVVRADDGGGSGGAQARPPLPLPPGQHVSDSTVSRPGTILSFPVLSSIHRPQELAANGRH